MRVRHALEGVDGEIEQNLDQIRAIDFDADVLGQRGDAEFIFLHAGMDAHELVQILSNWFTLTRGARFIRLAAEKTQVAPGNLNAIAHLPRDDAQTVLDEFQIFHFQLRSCGSAAG